MTVSCVNEKLCLGSKLIPYPLGFPHYNNDAARLQINRLFNVYVQAQDNIGIRE